MAAYGDGALHDERARRYLALRQQYRPLVTEADVLPLRKPLLEHHELAIDKAMLALMTPDERAAWLEYSDRETLYEQYSPRITQGQVIRHLIKLMERDAAGWLLTMPTPDRIKLDVSEIMALEAGAVRGIRGAYVRVTLLGDYDYEHIIPVKSKNAAKALALRITQRFDAWGEAELRSMPPGSPEPPRNTPLGSYLLRHRGKAGIGQSIN